MPITTFSPMMSLSRSFRQQTAQPQLASTPTKPSLSASPLPPKHGNLFGTKEPVVGQGLALPNAKGKPLRLACRAQPQERDIDALFATLAQRLQSDLPGAVIERLRDVPKDKEDVAKLWQDTFIAQEPMAKCLHQNNKDDFKKAMQLFTSDAIHAIASEDLSAVVRDKQGNIVACLLASTYQHEDLPNLPELAPLQPIFSVLNTLADKFSVWKKQQLQQGNSVGPTLHLLIAATKAKIKSKVIAKTLFLAVISNARRYGFEDIVAEATSGSRILLRIQGFEELDQVAYQDYPVFQQIDSKAKVAALMYKKIGPPPSQPNN